MNVKVSSWGSMLNGITNNGILNTQLGKNSEVFGVATNPIKNPYANVDKGLFIDETNISNEAVTMYEHEQDVKKFNTIALSNPEDTSHDDMVQSLFSQGVSDPLAEESVEGLSSNSRLLNDLEL